MYKLIILFRTGSKVINCYDDFDLEEKIDFYTIMSKFSLDMADELFVLIEEQHQFTEAE